MLEQPGFCRTCSETKLLVFPLGGSFVLDRPSLCGLANFFFFDRPSLCGLAKCFGQAPFVWTGYLNRLMRKPTICICENKDTDQLHGTAKLISACVFATRIEQFLYFLNQKFPFSSYLPTARFLSHQFGNDIVGFSRTGRLICFGQAQFVWNGKAFLADPFESRTYVKRKKIHQHIFINLFY